MIQKLILCFPNLLGIDVALKKKMKEIRLTFAPECEPSWKAVGTNQLWQLWLS